LRRVEEASVDKFEQRKFFEERYQPRVEIFGAVTTLNCVREGRLRSWRVVWAQRNERLVSLGVRPPKVFWSFMSDPTT